MVVREGRNRYFNAKNNAQNSKIAFKMTQKLNQVLIHNYIAYQIINEIKINIKRRKKCQKALLTLLTLTLHHFSFHILQLSEPALKVEYVFPTPLLRSGHGQVKMK